MTGHAAPVEDERLVDEAFIYKETSNSDLVVIRKLELYERRFVTYHDHAKDASDNKTWVLDRKCVLDPPSAADINCSFVKWVRPRGTWTITASIMAIGSKDKEVTLWGFTLSWPTSWAAKGYTSFKFMFNDQALALHWWGNVSDSIAALSHLAEAPGLLFPPAKAGSVARLPTPSMSGAMLTSTASMLLRSPSGAGAAFQAPDTPRAMAAAAAAAAVQPLTAPLLPSPQEGIPLTFGEVSSLPGTTVVPLVPLLPLPLAPPPPPQLQAVGLPHTLSTGRLASTAGSLSRTAAAAATAPHGSASGSEDGEDAPPFAVTNQGIPENWAPYRQTNGVAVYHHTQQDDSTGVGGEYMVSAVVRGTPRQALDALMSTRAHTHILGPTKSVEVLQAADQGPDAGEDQREVLRLVLEPPAGLARRVCAARELVIERMLKRDEVAGVFVVLFSSCDPPAPVSGTIPAAKPAAAGFWLWRFLLALVSWMWLWRNVRGKIRGAWSIAPLEGYKLDTSPESLVTCIVKADLGGVFSERSLVKGVADMLGWTDAFLDRILMTVTIIRDAVEHRRFAVHPFGLLSQSGSPAAGAQDGMVQERSLPSAATSAGPSTNFGRMSTRMVSRGPSYPPLTGRGSNLAEQAALHGLPEDSVVGGTHSGTSPAAGAASPFAADPALSTPPTSARTAASAFASAAGVASEAAAGGSAGKMSAAGTQAGDGDEFAEEEEQEGPLLDLEYIKTLSLLKPGIWEDIHTPGKDAPFRVRGPTYLKDRKKIPAGQPQFLLSSMDVIELEPGQPTHHIARWIPAIRLSGAPFAFVINLIIPGNPLLCIVTTFVNEHHPDILGDPPLHPMEEQHNWQPFDLVLHRYLHGDEATRASIFKLIPHIADGSWMIKSSVGTTPVIIGKALQSKYYETEQYLEIDIDVTQNTVANYVTGLVRGATKSLVIDLAFVLEGQTPWELPESLLGCMRLKNLDLKLARKIDTENEIPLKPAPGRSNLHAAMSEPRRTPRMRGTTSMEVASSGVPPVPPLAFLRSASSGGSRRQTGTAATSPTPVSTPLAGATAGDKGGDAESEAGHSAPLGGVVSPAVPTGPMGAAVAPPRRTSSPSGGGMRGSAGRLPTPAGH